MENINKYEVKNILLIGGSQGIGLEVAKLLEKDYEVYAACRTKGVLENLDVNYLEYDALEDASEDLDLPDTIDGLVFCPGTINLKPFKMLSPEAYEKDFNMNFMSLVKTLHGIFPKLKKAKQASLVFFSTVAVQTGMPFHTSIAASKGAIEGFTKSLAAEHAPQMRVNAIAPSLIDTPLAEKLLGSDKKKDKMAERHPLKRVGKTVDIANMTEFLLSDKSSWISGQVLGVDGGMSSLNIQ